MTRTTLRVFLYCLVLLTAGAAFAEENEELVEKVAVRNRLFSVEGRFELGANVGFSFLPRLTDHYNLNLSVAYNVKDWLAFEARGGYAISRLTSLAEQVQQDFFFNTSISRATDAADLWRMTGHGVLGIRFQPIYGKLNLMSELPVHFQTYLFAGGGVTGLVRESMVQCPDREACFSYFGNNREGETPFTVEGKVSPLVSLALGLRFFAADHHSVKVEMRSWSYLDSYRQGMSRTCTTGRGCATAGDGMDSPNAGITNQVQFDIGYSYTF